MKKCILAAAFAAISACAFAQCQTPASCDGLPPPPPKEGAAAPAAGKERPAFDREAARARMQQRRAERLAQATEAIKAAGIADEAKARALAESLEKIYRGRAMGMGQQRQGMRRGAAGAEGRPAARKGRKGEGRAKPE